MKIFQKMIEWREDACDILLKSAEKE